MCVTKINNDTKILILYRKRIAMDRKLRIRILIVSLFLLFLIGIGTFFYMGIISRERTNEVNLYTLVPADCNAVFETSDLKSLINEIKCSEYAKEFSSLKNFRIINDLRTHYDTFMMLLPKETSSRLNRILISFHSSGQEKDQVIYANTTSQDDGWIEERIRESRAIDFPIKKISYRGEKIRVCPMGGDLFLCYYKSSGFIAVSYSERLIKQVIDAHLNGKSILDNPSFGLSKGHKSFNGVATLHVRSKQFGWSNLNIKFSKNAIRLSGSCADADTSSSFINALKEQTSVKLISRNDLPRYTYYAGELSISSLEYIAANTARQQYALSSFPDNVKEADIHLMHFLKAHASDRLTSMSFYPEDTIRRPFSIISIPVKDSLLAERDMKQVMPGKEIMAVRSQILYAGNNSYRLYLLPKNTIFEQLSGIKDPDLNSYVVFYKNLLLLAPDPMSILSYISQMNNVSILKFDNPYNECISHLSDNVSYIQMADLEEMNLHPECISRSIPDFFFQQIDFFKHFILCGQIVSKDRAISSDVWLTYKVQTDKSRLNTDSLLGAKQY